MKILYFDLGMGAAGDMLFSSLLELVPDREAFIDRLNAMGIPGVKYVSESSVKCGIKGTHVSVLVDGKPEHEHENGHGHHHEHEGDDEHEHEDCGGPHKR